MTKPMIRIHNTETDEIIDREMTAAELKDFEAKKAAYLAEKQIFVDQQNAKQSAIDKLTALGLTADEVAALLP